MDDDASFADSILAFIEDYSKIYLNNSLDSTEQSIIDSVFNYYLINDTVDGNLFDPVFNDHLSSAALDEIDSLGSLLAENYATYGELKDTIIEWEDHVNSLADLPQNEKRHLLNSGNVSRYSSLFWFNYNPNSYKTNHKIGGPSDPDRQGFLLGYILAKLYGYSETNSLVIGILAGAIATVVCEPEGAPGVD